MTPLLKFPLFRRLPKGERASFKVVGGYVHREAPESGLHVSWRDDVAFFADSELEAAGYIHTSEMGPFIERQRRLKRLPAPVAKAIAERNDRLVRMVEAGTISKEVAAQLVVCW